MTPRQSHKLLWSETSPLGDHIEILDYSHLIQLRVNRVWQGESWKTNACLLPTPYMQQMMMATYYSRHVRQFLVIGLGAGCIPKALHALFPRATVHVVEIDPAIVRLAGKFFDVPTGSDTGPGIRVFTADGLQFIQRPPTTYDAIFVDAFAGSELPAGFRTPRAMWHLRNALARGGVLAVNMSQLDLPAIRIVKQHMTRYLGKPTMYEPKNRQRRDDLNAILLAPVVTDPARAQQRRSIIHAHKSLLGMDVDELLANEVPPIYFW